MRKLADETGVVRGLLVLVILLVVVGALYLTQSRGKNVAEVGKDVAVDLEQAAESVRDTSEDALLTAKVKSALALSKTASAFDIDVDSDEGVVTLTGSVASEEARAAVAGIARDTAGVVEVVDRVQIDAGVTPGTQADRLAERLVELEIQSAVYEGFLRAEGIDSRAIRVSVDGRVVRLTGSVPDSSHKERAATLAASIAGVEAVRNELEVATGAAAVSGLETTVRERLRASGAIGLDSVQVEVDSGIVTLAGRVGSEAERQLAEALARGTEGVVAVVNRLSVAHFGV
jgi:hyperosmotically inducible protein